MFLLKNAKPFFSLNQQSSNADLDATTAIDLAWIDELKKKKNCAYETPETFLKKLRYEKDLDCAYVKNTKKNDIYERHNPFKLRLPYDLEGYDRLYNHTKIRDSYGLGVLNSRLAQKSYFDFLRQYNSAYITYLEAINRTDKAIILIKELFSSNKMFANANVSTDFLSDNIKKEKSDFLLALFAYLTLNILYSSDEPISTAARIRALEVLRENFDIKKIARAFSKFDLGYCIDDSYGGEELVYDLLPNSFILEARERGAVQNKIFLKNKKIKEIFKIPEKEFNPSYELDSGFSQLISMHPQETLQVLHSLLRQPTGVAVNKESRQLIFAMIISLAKLDPLKKEEIFGDTASYRNGGESKPGSSAKIDWAMGYDSFGDEIAYRRKLERLSIDKEETRLILSERNRFQLEQEIVGNLEQINKNYITLENDPKGYFSILALRPDISEDIFEDMLKRSYRVLARQYHPDKGGVKNSFKNSKKHTKSCQILSSVMRIELNAAVIQVVLGAVKAYKRIQICVLI